MQFLLSVAKNAFKMSLQILPKHGFRLTCIWCFSTLSLFTESTEYTGHHHKILTSSPMDFYIILFLKIVFGADIKMNNLKDSLRIL